MTSYAIALLALVALAVAWVGVQRSWRRVFPDGDPDALVGRLGCAGCDCEEPCEEGRRQAVAAERREGS